MKKHLIYATAVAIAMSAVFVSCKKDKGKEIEGNVTDTFLGTIAFKTDKIWIITDTTYIYDIHGVIIDTLVHYQEWSDVVIATGCKKDNFKGYDSIQGFCEDCRQNSGYGDLFSWGAVKQYDSLLCPDGWRVPTKEDFVILDTFLGGTGNNGQLNPTLCNEYLNTWGATYGGRCDSHGSLLYQSSYAYYWSQSELSSGGGYYLYFNSGGGVYPQDSTLKGFGRSLRCVR